VLFQETEHWAINLASESWHGKQMLEVISSCFSQMFRGEKMEDVMSHMTVEGTDDKLH
jgi:hypothetical protein